MRIAGLSESSRLRATVALLVVSLLVVGLAFVPRATNQPAPLKPRPYDRNQPTPKMKRLSGKAAADHLHQACLDNQARGQHREAIRSAFVAAGAALYPCIGSTVGHWAASEHLTA